jgi:hypothetical protein
MVAKGNAAETLPDVGIKKRLISGENIKTDFYEVRFCHSVIVYKTM